MVSHMEQPRPTGTTGSNIAGQAQRLEPSSDSGWKSGFSGATGEPLLRTRPVSARATWHQQGIVLSSSTHRAGVQRGRDSQCPPVWPTAPHRRTQEGCNRSGPWQPSPGAAAASSQARSISGKPRRPAGQWMAAANLIRSSDHLIKNSDRDGPRVDPLDWGLGRPTSTSHFPRFLGRLHGGPRRLATPASQRRPAPAGPGMELAQLASSSCSSRTDDTTAPIPASRMGLSSHKPLAHAVESRERARPGTSELFPHARPPIIPSRAQLAGPPSHHPPLLSRLSLLHPLAVHTTSHTPTFTHPSP